MHLNEIFKCKVMSKYNNVMINSQVQYDEAINLLFIITLYVVKLVCHLTNEPRHGKMCLRGKFGHFEIL